MSADPPIKEQQLAKILRDLADHIEEGRVNTSHIRMSADTVSFEMPDFTLKHYHNGQRDIHIDINYYNPKFDNRSQYKKDLEKHDSQRT